MTIKAITIIQPWASLIAIGAKSLETRSWSARHNGPIAIHAGVNRGFIDLCGTEPFLSVLDRHALHPGNLPFGCVVAIARLAQNDPVEGIRDRLSDQERAFGDYRDGRYGWLLECVKPLKTPIPATGQQGLWDWEAPSGLLESYLQQTGGERTRIRRHERPTADARDR